MTRDAWFFSILVGALFGAVTGVGIYCVVKPDPPQIVGDGSAPLKLIINDDHYEIPTRVDTLMITNERGEWRLTIP